MFCSFQEHEHNSILGLNSQLAPSMTNAAGSARTEVSGTTEQMWFCAAMATTCTTEERCSQQCASISQSIRHTSEPSASPPPPAPPPPLPG